MIAGQYVDGVNKRRMSSSRPRAVQQQITLLCLWYFYVDINIRNTNQESSATPAFTFTFISLSWQLSCVELFSASSGAMHQPSLSNSSSDNDTRALQINTDPHIETNQHSEKSSTTAFQNQPLKKVHIWHRRKVVFKELWSQVKCSTWPSRYLWWIEEAGSQDQFKW